MCVCVCVCVCISVVTLGYIFNIIYNMYNLEYKHPITFSFQNTVRPISVTEQVNTANT